MKWICSIVWTVAHQVPPSMGFSCKEVLEWSCHSLSEGSSWPRMNPGLLHSVNALASEPPGKHWNSRRGGDCTTVKRGSLVVSFRSLLRAANSEHGVGLRCSSSWKILLVEIKQKIFGYSILNSVFWFFLVSVFCTLGGEKPIDFSWFA